MNRLPGIVRGIDSHGSMSLVEVAVDGDVFSAYVLETPRSCAYLREGKRIDLLVKETEVSLARPPLGSISIGNCFAARVNSVEEGKLLAQVALDYKGMKVTAVLGTRAVRKMTLIPGEEVLWLIKSTELTLAEASS
jgi:molybdate transport system regulatory protein